MSIRKRDVDPRIVRTRQVLEYALMELMCEQEFEHITVQDVTNRAELNRTTFYLHYHDVRDLLEHIVEQELTALQTTMTATVEAPLFSQPAIRSFIGIFEHIAGNERFYRLLFTNSSMAQYTLRLFDLFLNFMSDVSNLVQPDDQSLTAPRRMAARYLASGVIGVVYWWVSNGLPYTPKFMATQLGHLNLNGPYAPLQHFTFVFDSAVKNSII